MAAPTTYGRVMSEVWGLEARMAELSHHVMTDANLEELARRYEGAARMIRVYLGRPALGDRRAEGDTARSP